MSIPLRPSLSVSWVRARALVGALARPGRPPPGPSGRGFVAVTARGGAAFGRAVSHEMKLHAVGVLHAVAPSYPEIVSTRWRFVDDASLVCLCWRRALGFRGRRRRVPLLSLGGRSAGRVACGLGGGGAGLCPSPSIPWPRAMLCLPKTSASTFSSICGCCSRKVRAFSRPCPMRSPWNENHAPLFSTMLRLGRQVDHVSRVS